MAYSLNLLTTVGDCNTILLEKATERQEMMLDKAQLELSLQQGQSLVQNLPAMMQSVENRIQQLEVNISTAEPGRERRKAERDLNIAENQLSRLVDRSERYGALGRIDREYDLVNLTREVEALDTLVAEITSRMAEIEGQATVPS